MEIIIIIIIIIINIMPVRSNLYCVLILARTIVSNYRDSRLKEACISTVSISVACKHVAHNILLCVCVCARAFMCALFKHAIS
jgi:cellulose synthase/poly-beta-1,6-N-acetylglucosamine synthase-like glycosyltransferase